MTVLRWNYYDTLQILFQNEQYLKFLMNRKYGLEPFVVEDYGNMNASVHVVAVARKRDHYMTLFNLKSKFSSEKLSSVFEYIAYEVNFI